MIHFILYYSLMSKTNVENIAESVDINDESNTEEFTTGRYRVLC